MRSPSLSKALCIFAFAATFVAIAAEDTSCSWYAGGSAAIVLPQGGSQMRRAGGALVRGGCYLNDDLALEGEVGALEDMAEMGLSALWHWQGAAIYGDYFGYSRIDPFFTLGAVGFVGGSRGQVGPRAGAGAFYHLTDSWSLRGDASAILGLDGETEVDYALSLGLQYSF